MPLNNDLPAACSEGAVVCGGAMGAQLIQRRLTAGESAMQWNQDRASDAEAVRYA